MVAVGPCLSPALHLRCCKLSLGSYWSSLGATSYWSVHLCIELVDCKDVWWIHRWIDLRLVSISFFAETTYKFDNSFIEREAAAFICERRGAFSIEKTNAAAILLLTVRAVLVEPVRRIQPNMYALSLIMGLHWNMKTMSSYQYQSMLACFVYWTILVYTKVHGGVKIHTSV